MHLSPEIHKLLEDYYNKKLSPLFYQLNYPLCVNQEVSKILFSKARDYLESKKNKFCPEKGKALTYFATMLKNWCLSEIKRLEKNLEYRDLIFSPFMLSFTRDEKINILLN